jgi:hypothetical protein
MPSPVPKFSVAKLFQGPSTQSTPAPPTEAASPASRSAKLPSQAPSLGQLYAPPYTLGSNTLCQGQNGNPSVPWSPVYSRPINGQSSGASVCGRPQAGSGGFSAGPASTALSSPRMTPHPPPGPTSDPYKAMTMPVSSCLRGGSLQGDAHACEQLLAGWDPSVSPGRGGITAAPWPTSAVTMGHGDTATSICLWGGPLSWP